MNQQIEQLALQAGFNLHNDVIDGHDFKHEIEKFAELILLECMHECLRMQLGNQYTPEELLFQTKYRKIIKEHFGVEE